MATYLITGGNRGLGFELCRQLHRQGHHVIATCRSQSPQLEELGIQIETGMDITKDASINRLITSLTGISIDVLINNAGILEKTSLDELNPESLRRQFEVNAIGPLRLTRSLLDQLKPGAKVVLITSRMGSIEDNSSGGSYGYRMSKAALCMAGKSLSIDIKPRGIALAIIHPGLVSTRMTNFTAHGITPEVSVEGILERINELDLASSGSFWHANGERLPW
ncbi:MAG: SDR family oxidoreductase [Prochlorococcus sp.]